MEGVEPGNVFFHSWPVECASFAWRVILCALVFFIKFSNAIGDTNERWGAAICLLLLSPVKFWVSTPSWRVFLGLSLLKFSPHLPIFLPITIWLSRLASELLYNELVQGLSFFPSRNLICGPDQ